MITLVGILNVTPDSFSDGGEYFTSEAGLKQAYKLLEDGAEILDIGADSTRPGSACCGEDEEWRRLEPVLNGLPGSTRFFVDTHHPGVAAKALALGAAGINDVFGGRAPGMLELLAGYSKARLVLMYSRCDTPHHFGPEAQGDLFDTIYAWLKERVETALRAGIRREQIILDPGMGAFVSAERGRALRLLERFVEFSSLGFDMMLGISRKGFVAPQQSPQARDTVCSKLTQTVLKLWPPELALFLRVHAPAVYGLELESTIHL